MTRFLYIYTDDATVAVLGSGSVLRGGSVKEMSRKMSGLAIVALAAWLVAGCTTPVGDAAGKEKAISEALAEAAYGAQQSFDYRRAASHYQRLYERNPDNIAALVGYARNLRYGGHVMEAIRAIRKGIGKHGEKPDLVLELGKAQLAASLLEDSRISLSKALKLMPDRWDVHSAMGILYDRTGKFDAAKEEYRKALELAPRNTAALNNLALSLAQAGKLDAGIDILKKLARSEYSTVQTRQNLALLYGLKGDFVNAERLIREDLPPEVAAENLAKLREIHKGKLRKK